jgi:hypothetical protein
MTYRCDIIEVKGRKTMSKENRDSLSEIEEMLSHGSPEPKKDDGNPDSFPGKGKKPNLQEKAKKNIEAVSRKLRISPVQAIIFSYGWKSQ